MNLGEEVEWEIQQFVNVRNIEIFFEELFFNFNFDNEVGDYVDEGV